MTTAGWASVGAVLRATMIVGAIGVPIVLLVPESAPLVPLALTTLWMRGPFSGFIPVGLEPVLMAYGGSYSPWLVTLVAAAASAYAEIVSQHVIRGIVGLPKLDAARSKCRTSRIMRRFERRPAVAIALTALSPIPDCITRTLAAVSGYPVARYVVADTLGRLPKLLIPAAIGAAFRVPHGWLVGTMVGSVVLGLAVGFGRYRRAHSRTNLGAASW